MSHRVAIVSDIHGNAVALAAVLSDIERRSVDALVCLGDLVACGPAPQAVLDLLHERACPCVLGNTDEWFLGRLLPKPHQRDYDRLLRLIEWGTRAVGDDGRRYLASLPPRLELELDGGRLLCFHGSPRSSVEPVLAETPSEALADMLGLYASTAYAAGHTHLQLVRGYAGALVVNAGSVGVPLPFAPSAPASAEYAIVSAGPSGAEAELRRVAVDPDAAAAATRATGMPYPDEWAAMLARRVTRANERARAAFGHGA